MLLRRHKVAEVKQVSVKPLGNVDGGLTKKESKTKRKKSEK